MDTLLESVLPKSEMTGLVMHLDDDDYFLYFNDINNFEARLVIDKPANYMIVGHIEFSEFIRRALPVMERFLAEEKVFF